MNVWSHLPTIFNRRLALQQAGLIAIVIALITTLFFANIAFAATNKVISFQARLSTGAGAVVPDGRYNIQFKIYEGGDGTEEGNPGGTLKWTETYVNDNNSGGVRVKNGVMSVNLGAKNAFGNSVDWSNDTLWLSMNIAGRAGDCTTFDSGSCEADGEMLPMKRITAVPFALNADNANTVGGKGAGDLVQLGQGAQTDASSNSSVFINKTGSGNLVQLQANGSDAFTVNNAGNISLGSAADQSISVSQSSSGGGKSLSLAAGGAATGSEQSGGDLLLQGGAGDGSANSGNVVVKANGENSSGTFQVQNADGNAVLNVDTTSSIVSVGTLQFIPAIEGQTVEHSLWDDSTPTGGVYTDSNINLGTVFQTDTPGVVTGVKYYRPAGGNASGTDIGQLWACTNANCSIAGGGTGSIMASVTFPVDLSAGWKTAYFSSPVRIQPGVKYIISYYKSSGPYMATSNYFQTPYANSPLSAPADGASPNGVFYQGSNADSNFPNTSFNKTNYWVDVKFEADAYTADRITSSNALEITGAEGVTLGSVADPTNIQGSSVMIEGAESIKLQSSGVDLFTTRLVNGQATASIGNDGSSGYGLDVTGIINASEQLRVGTGTTLENSALTFTGTNPTQINTASSLTLSGQLGVNASVDGKVTMKIGENNVLIGDGLVNANTALLTLDKADSAPGIADSADWYGSMYYDTTLGKVQCYEADGWGACGAAPDTFVTLSPEYSNAVMNGADIGTITSDLCSDTLNINDGSSGQPTVCGTDETQNFYGWTSEESTDQTRSVYVTYQLPDNFKEFVAGSTSLMGRTDSSDASVSYRIYRDSANSGLISCGGSATSVSSGSQSSWQTVSMSGGSDPSTCGFEAGESILIRINMTAKSDANAYVSDLNFTYSSE